MDCIFRQHFEWQFFKAYRDFASISISIVCMHVCLVLSHPRPARISQANHSRYTQLHKRRRLLFLPSDTGERKRKGPSPDLGGALGERAPQGAPPGHDDGQLVVAVGGPGVVARVQPPSPRAARGPLTPGHGHRHRDDQGPHAARLLARGGPVLPQLWKQKEEEEEEEEDEKIEEVQLRDKNAESWGGGRKRGR